MATTQRQQTTVGGSVTGLSSEHSVGFLANRRMSKDYERKVQTSETLIQVAMIRLLLARLARHL